ncbi:hypothetical protein ABS767_10900 [Sphingomonas sp. ST-64]|uniref:Uncharacterized protein n=1 Tax=Sphingomonas plantiphila TaxID=3163295 RepID=A0ABW8YPB0_9SPHN
MAHKFAAVLATDNRTATRRARQAKALREIAEARDYVGKPLSDNELAERFRDHIAELDKALAQASGVRAMVKTLESWRDALPTRLPKGFGIWKGVDYDFEGLGASSKLWRDKDANCCPSGGDALIDFAIEGRSLVLKDVRVDIVERWRPRRTD